MSNVNAYPLDPTIHNVKRVIYHRLNGKTLALCNSNLIVDTDSGIDFDSLLKSELCGKCFPEKGYDHEIIT
jgi:hypothetical protein